MKNDVHFLYEQQANNKYYINFYSIIMMSSSLKSHYIELLFNHYSILTITYFLYRRGVMGPTCEREGRVSRAAGPSPQKSPDAPHSVGYAETHWHTPHGSPPRTAMQYPLTEMPAPHYSMHCGVQNSR